MGKIKLNGLEKVL